MTPIEARYGLSGGRRGQRRADGAGVAVSCRVGCSDSVGWARFPRLARRGLLRLLIVDADPVVVEVRFGLFGWGALGAGGRWRRGSGLGAGRCGSRAGLRASLISACSIPRRYAE